MKSGENPVLSLKTTTYRNRYGTLYVPVNDVLSSILQYQKDFRGSGLSFKPEQVLDPIVAILGGLR